MVDNITNQNNINHSSVKSQTVMVDNITTTWTTPLSNLKK